MMMIRPIEHRDLAALMVLAQGKSSSPADEQRLATRIECSIKSFAGMTSQDAQSYLFVEENLTRGQLIGAAALKAAVGLKTPWYNYRMATVVHASEALGIYKRHQALFLSNDHTGCSELGGVFLHPDHRVYGHGALLSKSRLLFLAQFPDLFSDRVVAELRGVLDGQGKSPFWEGLGRHFFSMDFLQADYLTGLGEKTFVAELMPKHPIYVELLPEASREVIGQPHPEAQPVLAMLRAEGFRCEGYVDIFDAGPALQADTHALRIVRESRLLPVKIIPLVGDESERLLVCNTYFADFRAMVIDSVAGQTLALTAQQAEALRVKEGDNVRCVTLSR